jgi:hypothetical protein
LPDIAQALVVQRHGQTIVSIATFLDFMKSHVLSFVAIVTRIAGLCILTLLRSLEDYIRVDAAIERFSTRSTIVCLLSKYDTIRKLHK